MKAIANILAIDQAAWKSGGRLLSFLRFFRFLSKLLSQSLLSGDVGQHVGPYEFDFLSPINLLHINISHHFIEETRPVDTLVSQVRGAPTFL